MLRCLRPDCASTRSALHRLKRIRDLNCVGGSRGSCTRGLCASRMCRVKKSYLKSLLHQRPSMSHTVGAVFLWGPSCASRSSLQEPADIFNRSRTHRKFMNRDLRTSRNLLIAQLLFVWQTLFIFTFFGSPFFKSRIATYTLEEDHIFPDIPLFLYLNTPTLCSKSYSNRSE